MESIGSKLRGAREEKGYSIDQVARDTNIARRFLEAMEREDFSVFPGDTYVLGFLRNYSDYLGLNPDKVITLYRNLKIQEQPIPVEELIRPKKKLPLRAIALVIVAAAVLGAGGYGIYYYMQNRSVNEEPVAEEQGGSPFDGSRQPDHIVDEEIIEQRFSADDLLRVHFDEKTGDLYVEEVGERVHLQYPEGAVTIALGKEELIDFNGDGSYDIRVGVHDIDTSADTAVLRLDRGIFETGGEEAEQQRAEESENTDLKVGSTSEESRVQEEETILTADEAEPFQVSFEFRGYCLVRYEKDGEDREEQFFNEGEILQFNADEEVMFWISNAGSLDASIAGEEVSFGDPGEVSTKLIRWEREEDSDRRRLKLIPVY
ncbi:MAG: helix-turn-helix domain-containing protein [Spirochaetia bacterium]